MANTAQQVANVRGAFAVTGDPPPGPGLLVDDIRFSGWTLAMTAGQLRRRGAPRGLPAGARDGVLSTRRLAHSAA